MGAKKLHPCRCSGVKCKQQLHGSTLLTARCAPSLVTAVTGGPVPVIPGSSGVVLPALCAGAFHQNGPLSVRRHPASSPSTPMSTRYYSTAPPLLSRGELPETRRPRVCALPPAPLPFPLPPFRAALKRIVKDFWVLFAEYSKIRQRKSRELQSSRLLQGVDGRKSFIR